MRRTIRSINRSSDFPEARHTSRRGREFRRPGRTISLELCASMILAYQNLSDEQLRSAADIYEHVARGLEQNGHPWLAQFGHIAAAEIDLLNDENKQCWGGPFNGQTGRTAIMEAILKTCLLENVVETGTFRGTTTEYLAQRVIGRVYSCENEPRYFLYSRRRLEPLGNVEIHLGDSRAFLQTLLSRESVCQARTLFYLDAHWSIDLPLASEVEIILKNHPASVIAIDDFEIPHDRGYGFDNYGPDKRLSLPILAAFRSAVPNFYVPSIGAAEETGAKRGCIWFASNEYLDQLLAQVPNLRRVDERDWALYDAQAERVEGS
ncbi:MAG: hypothetical protein WBW33_26040 [Bryobacteraceae bacterium]